MQYSILIPETANGIVQINAPEVKVVPLADNQLQQQQQTCVASTTTTTAATLAKPVTTTTTTTVAATSTSTDKRYLNNMSLITILQLFRGKKTY